MDLKKCASLLMIVALLLIATSSPIIAQVGDTGVRIPGLESISGQIARIEAPLSLAPGQLVDDFRAFVFLERDNFSLPNATKVNAAGTGSFSVQNLNAESTLTTGMVVNSYFVTFRPSGSLSQLTALNGSITFTDDIVGLIFVTADITTTTPRLKANRTNYSSADGLEAGDRISVSADRRVFRWTFDDHTELDQVRIITSNDSDNAPSTRNDTATTAQNQEVTVDVLGNDTDPNDNIRINTLRVTRTPSNGTASVNSNTGEISYVPNNGFTGSDNLTYEICDSTDLCATATLTVTIGADTSGDGQTPNAVADVVSTPENRTVIVDVLDNDTDPNNDLSRDSLRISNSPSSGTAAVEQDSNGNATGEIQYIPENNFQGSVTLTYEICDSTNRCDTATLRINVGTGGSGLEPGTLLPRFEDCSNFDQARVDVVPGNRDNPIRLEDDLGHTAVAILSTENFHAPNCVDVSTVTFGQNGTEAFAVSCGAINVNFDPWVDVICDFVTSDLGFEEGDDEGRLMADTIDGDTFDLEDEVLVVVRKRFQPIISSLDITTTLVVKSLQLRNSMHFVSTGLDVAQMELQIFALNGKQIYQRNAGSNELRWNLTSSDGQRLANGVYLSIVSAVDSTGQIHQQISKFVLIR